MRNRALQSRRATPKSFPISRPPPIGGWNTRDSLDAMAPDDAVLMDNLFPAVGKCEVRNGYEVFATGIGSGDVETLAEFHVGTDRDFIATGGGQIYECSGGGAATSLGSGFSEDLWQTEMFANYLHMVNGTDAPQQYDGTTLSAASFTGPTLADLIDVTSYRSRLYFVEKDSQSAWYGGVAAVSGALTEFNIKDVGNFGGNLLTIGRWTKDGGEGADDFIAFIMTSGEVLVYSGGDPGTDFALVGVYEIGVPLNRRSVIKVTGDLLIATTSDYVSMSQVLKNGQVGVASKLSGAIIEAADANPTATEWQLVLHRKGQKIISNVPNTDGSYDQHVLNTITGAACRFKDIPSFTWCVYNDDLYFGSTDGKVYKFTGYDDNGAGIEVDAQQAWDHFNYPQPKKVCAMRPIIQSNGSVEVKAGVGEDFVAANIDAAQTTSASSAPWDTSPWDTTAWGDSVTVDNLWMSGSGYADSLSARVRLNALQYIAWLRTDYRIEPSRTL